jgi:hypothetical protein
MPIVPPSHLTHTISLAKKAHAQVRTIGSTKPLGAMTTSEWWAVYRKAPHYFILTKIAAQPEPAAPTEEQIEQMVAKSERRAVEKDAPRAKEHAQLDKETPKEDKSTRRSRKVHLG